MDDFSSRALNLTSQILESIKDIKDDEPLIYALLEAAQTRLNDTIFTEEYKGKIVSDLIEALGEINKQELALHREMIRYLIEVKDSTVH